MFVAVKKEVSLKFHDERQGFKADARFYLESARNPTQPWSCNYCGSLWKYLIMFDILRAGDGAWFTVASKNDHLEGTQK